MTENSIETTTPVPPDDPQRQLAVARPDDEASLPHIGLAGNTYTILLSGDQTGGQYCLIDMHVPPGGGPGPHRHDFEEMFTVLEGEIAMLFRGETTLARAGETVNIPANAPHAFTNVADRPARLLCMCAPAGQEEFFLAIGDRIATRTTPAPLLNAEQRREKQTRAAALAQKYRTEMLDSR